MGLCQQHFCPSRDGELFENLAINAKKVGRERLGWP